MTTNSHNLPHPPHWPPLLQICGSFLPFLRSLWSLSGHSPLVLPAPPALFPLVAPPRPRPHSYPSYSSIPIHFRLNGLKDCTPTLSKEGPRHPPTCPLPRALLLHLPSLLIHGSLMSPFHPYCILSSRIRPTSSSTSNFPVHLHHLTLLDPHLEYSTPPLYITFRQYISHQQGGAKRCARRCTGRCTGRITRRCSSKWAHVACHLLPERRGNFYPQNHSFFGFRPITPTTLSAPSLSLD